MSLTHQSANMDDQTKKRSDASTDGGSIALEDDVSWMSKTSADVVLKSILKETGGDPLADNMIIDIVGSDDDLDALVEPLEDPEEEEGENATIVALKKEKPAVSVSPWQAVFSTQEELARSQQVAASFSQESTGTANGAEQSMITKLDDDEISSLMQGDLLELPKLVRPVSPDTPRQVVVPTAGGDIIHRVMAILRHLERDQHILSRAEEIVRECQYYHQKGNIQFQNLVTSTFDRLVHLLGAPKFNDIYHRAHLAVAVDPRRDPRFAAMYQGPNDVPVQLAIAYGMHLARASNESDPPLRIVQNGIAALKSMSHKERGMFWDFMTKRPGA